jgi:hypothetical protein
MCLPRTYVAVILSLALVIPELAQQAGNASVQSSPKSLAFLQKSLAGITGGQSISDITLSGAAQSSQGRSR